MSNDKFNSILAKAHRSALKRFHNLGLYRVWISATAIWFVISCLAIFATDLIERRAKMVVALDDCIYGLGDYAVEKDGYGIDFNFDQTLEDELRSHNETLAKRALCEKVVALRPAKRTTQYLSYEIAIATGFLTIPIIIAYFLLGFLPKHAPRLVRRYVDWLKQGFKEPDHQE
jgi:hypothetical protein